jgi:hypothetical protein
MIVGRVIYGIPIKVDFDDYYSDEDDSFKDEDKLLEIAFLSKDKGFLSFKNIESDYTPRAFGVFINNILVNDFSFDIKNYKTEEVIEKFSELWKSLDNKLKEEIVLNFGKPKIFILWSDSNSYKN